MEPTEQRTEQIDGEDIPPGDYIKAFRNEFSSLSRKQVTAFEMFLAMRLDTFEYL
jgi:hypothetical protein